MREMRAGERAHRAHLHRVASFYGRQVGVHGCRVRFNCIRYTACNTRGKTLRIAYPGMDPFDDTIVDRAGNPVNSTGLYQTFLYAEGA